MKILEPPFLLVVTLCCMVASSPIETAQVTLGDGRDPVTINFDDLPTLRSGDGNITCPYNHLEFFNVSLLNTACALKSGLLSHKHELQCATSGPNAIFSSSYAEYVSEPPFMPDRSPKRAHSTIFLNSTRSARNGGPVGFNIVRLSIGPLGLTPNDEYLVSVYIDLLHLQPDGTRENIWPAILIFGEGKNIGGEVNFRDRPGYPFGSHINMIEIWAVAGGEWYNEGEGGTSWAWCLDDLVLEWLYEDGEPGDTAKKWG